jgi:hypothetical protein
VTPNNNTQTTTGNNCGHRFQGRSGAIRIEDEAGLQEAEPYVQLNPVRVKESACLSGRKLILSPPDFEA